MIRDMHRWREIAQEEAARRKQVFNVAVLSKEACKGILEAARPDSSGTDFMSLPQPKFTPALASLRKRLQALLDFFGIEASSSGYRKLLLLLLSECDIRAVECGPTTPNSRLNGLRRPQVPGGQKSAQTAAATLPLLSQLMSGQYTSPPMSKGKAIRCATRMFNEESEILDIIDPRDKPRRLTNEVAVKKAYQRAEENGKLPSIDSEDDESEAIDATIWQKALTLAAPRTDEWVDEIASALAAYRAGRRTADQCGELASGIMLRHIDQRETVSQMGTIRTD